MYVLPAVLIQDLSGSIFFLLPPKTRLTSVVQGFNTVLINYKCLSMLAQVSSHRWDNLLLLKNGSYFILTHTCWFTQRFKYLR